MHAKVVLVARIPKVHISVFARLDLNMTRLRAAKTLTNVKVPILGQHVAMVIVSTLLVVIHVNVNLDTFIKEKLSDRFKTQRDYFFIPPWCKLHRAILVTYHAKLKKTMEKESCNVLEMNVITTIHTKTMTLTMVLNVATVIRLILHGTGLSTASVLPRLVFIHFFL